MKLPGSNKDITSSRGGTSRGHRGGVRKRTLIPTAVLCCTGALYGWNDIAPMENGLAYRGEPRSFGSAAFFSDDSWIDRDGQRQIDQRIFDEMIRLVRGAKEIVLLDMFLFNDWQGPEPETTRQLSSEITQTLIEQKKNCTICRIVVISDPVNTVYGGTRSQHFDQMSEAGVEVIITDLTELHDSNPIYSFIWHWLIRPWGNSPANTLPNPLGGGKVSFRSYLQMINFKANHRKTLVVDNGQGSYTAMVTSANPHDGSSAHRNIAVTFDGIAAMDLIQTENAVLRLSGHKPVEIFKPDVASIAGNESISVLTEKRIKEAVLGELATTTKGDSVKLMMFYMSDRNIVRALTSAAERGVSVKVILDVNKDAFGRKKNGVPNRPVAHELIKHGVDVRWCNTRGEQCHAKLLLVQKKHLWSLIQGSANFTRRNLDNYNLESDVQVKGTAQTAVLKHADNLFDRHWNNTQDQNFTVHYDSFKDESPVKRWLYRFMEASGLSTF